jgi:hypothetical protein
MSLLPPDPWSGHEPLDQVADAESGTLRLRHRIPGPVMVCRALVAGRVPVHVPMEGYAFPWGQIVERAGLLWVFDFYLEHLRMEFAARDFEFVELQERVFAGLEAWTDCALREHGVAQQVLEQDGLGWKIVPAALGHGAVFSILGWIGAEKRLRHWLIGEFLPEILPEVQREVFDGLESP